RHLIERRRQIFNPRERIGGCAPRLRSACRSCHSPYFHRTTGGHFMRKPLAAILIAASVSTSACGHDRNADAGPMVSRSFQVGNFTEIEAAGPFEVTVRTGANPSVQAHGNKQLLDHLVVEVKGNSLSIHPEKRGGWFGNWGVVHGKAEVA